MKLCNYISITLFKQLIKLGFPVYKYPINSYDGKPVYYTKDQSDPDWINCDAYRVPTYAEVLDWLF